VPFCTSCGKQARDADQFCGHCGYRQPVSGLSPGPARSGAALSPRTASILCYVPWFGWIAGLYVLASDKFHQEHDSRFHAYQGLYLFVAWLLADWTLGLWVQMMPGPNIPLDKVVQLLILGLWIFMLVKTTKGVKHSLPVFGELAERSL
jgi:uncharacterized membrane protein